MPFSSQSQARFFYAVASGDKPKNGSDLSPAEAKKYISDTKGQKIGKLPVKKGRGKKILARSSKE